MNPDNPANFTKVEKYDRFFTLSDMGKAEYFVIDVNEMAENPKDHYLAIVKYHKGKKEVITPTLIDFNIMVQENRLAKF